MNKVICVVGATGIGKTKLSIELAKYLDTEIINGDAIQVFREVDILSAKASLDEQEGIKHHLLDFLDLNQRYDVASFKRDATKIIDDLNKQGKVPIVVGGSGLYLKSLLYDYKFEDVQERDLSKLARFDEYNNEELFAYLEKIDPTSALKLHPNNRRRVLRAVEIFETSALTKSEHLDKQSHTMEFDSLVIGLETDRARLYDRINQRVDLMVEAGLIEEVKYIDKNYPLLNAQVFQAIGYKELLPYLSSEITLEEALNKIKQNSRRYAKKQTTWFKNQMDITWIESNFEDFTQTIAIAKEKVRDFLYGETV